MNSLLAPLSEHWDFDPEILYLNHGAFGASPRVVEAARAKIQRRLESQPMRFLVREIGPALAATRHKLGEFVGADGDDLVLVPNSTHAMNIVAENFSLAAGDEILLNNHEYGAVKRTWERVCKQTGARIVEQDLPLPFTSAEALVDQLFAGVTERTKLLVFSHITSATAIIFPAEEICRRARELKIAVAIDGPHAIANLPLELNTLQCDFYGVSCHKWLCAPFGSGFLHVRKDHQQGLEPLVKSWGRAFPGAEPSWRDEFEWCGTYDPSAMIAIQAAIDFLNEYGIGKYRQETHAMARYAREQVTALTNLPPLTPDDASWYGPLVAMELPPGDSEDLQRRLLENHRVEVPIVDFEGKRLIRVSCPLYIGKEAIDALVAALKQEL